MGCKTVKLPPADWTPPLTLELPGLHPETRVRGFYFTVDRPRLEALELKGPAMRFWDALLIPDVLEHPAAILSGLKRPNYEDGVCYCATPAFRKVHEENVPAPPGMLLVVHASPRGDDRVEVRDWEWRKACPDRPTLPANWAHDFQRLLWPIS